MKHTVQWLQGKLDRIHETLEQGSCFSFSSQERHDLQKETKEILKKLASIEGGFLTIGLLGGTGVGKSTLMNALAGSEIAPASHRRPYTDQVLVYGHEETDLLSVLASSNVPWREISHTVNSIQHIVLCDLPDFDSLMGKHREHVLRFLEHLDVLIWVASPEKYADSRFHEFLRIVPKARNNFYFVLNKADLLFEGQDPESGYEQLARVTNQFQKHIKEDDIGQPLIYVISARQILVSDQTTPWNQFPTLKQHIFKQRDIKQITAIKAANLDMEVKQILRAFKKETKNLKSFETILESLIDEMQELRLQWMQAGQKAIDLWLGRDIKQKFISLQGDPSLLVGAGHVVSLFLRRWEKPDIEKKGVFSDLSSFVPPEEIKNTFRRRMEWLPDRLNNRVLRQNLPSSFRERLQDILDIPKTFEDLGEHFFYAVALRAAAPVAPSCRGFRALQYVAYLLLLMFFLLAIGGETQWKDVLANPGWASVASLFISAIHTLFSSKGLAALVSYTLLNVFFAFRFNRRYKKILQYAAQKAIDSLKVDLSKVWEEKLDSILQDLNRFKVDIQTQITAISGLTKK